MKKKKVESERNKGEKVSRCQRRIVSEQVRAKKRRAAVFRKDVVPSGRANTWHACDPAPEKKVI